MTPHTPTLLTFFFLCLVDMVVTNHFPFPPSTFLYRKFVGTCENPVFTAYNVSTVASRGQSGVDPADPTPAVFQDPTVTSQVRRLR